jgi:transcriptional regulator with XRE-family HTH domain
MSMHRSARKPSKSFLEIRRRGLGQLFGSMIQDRREMIGRSVEECARLAGMEFSEWAAIEAGHVPSDSDRVLVMAAALEIRLDQMAMMAFLCQDAWSG